AQKSTVITPDLPKLLKEKQLQVFNRIASVTEDKKYQNGIHLDAKANDGVAWLSDVGFENGSLEFDLKGKNVLQQSFLGIAFHGVNDSTMDVVYFRPFNFEAQDVQRRNHSVQYVSLPEFDWQRLRSQFPDQYEQPVNPAPKPDEWFHVRVEIIAHVVRVYVNNNPTPSLVVEQLSNREGGMVGFWTGNGSDGDFANLSITTSVR
ncbi:MAG TPA: hypothetical protein VHO68_07985, partial [Bacteroidales bacterium]|nr:hypothetical protein [Bacteroidales bacterium]